MDFDVGSNHALRNLVIREWIAHVLSAVELGGCWIVNQDGNVIAGGILLVGDQIVEIAAVKLQWWNRYRRRGRANPIAESLVSQEEESLAPSVIKLGDFYGAAQHGSEVVLPINGDAFREETARVEEVVADVLIGVAMELVGPRFGNEGDEAAPCSSILGFEPVGFHDELIDGIERG